jgi:hypothetical protein
MALSRRLFLTLPAACYAQTAGKGRVFGATVTRYADPATEFPVSRLTNPEYTSFLPAYPNRTIARNGSFLLYASDLTGRFEAFRLDLKSGQSKQLTDAAQLDPHSLVLLPDERGFCYIDEGRLVTASLVQPARTNRGRRRKHSCIKRRRRRALRRCHSTGKIALTG